MIYSFLGLSNSLVNITSRIVYIHAVIFYCQFIHPIRIFQFRVCFFRNFFVIISLTSANVYLSVHCWSGCSWIAHSNLWTSPLMRCSCVGSPFPFGHSDFYCGSETHSYTPISNYHWCWIWAVKGDLFSLTGGLKISFGQISIIIWLKTENVIEWRVVDEVTSLQYSWIVFAFGLDVVFVGSW